ncbi:LysR family transcriptional regulator [Kerstersia sp.]|uniref:LysR family transcriptional regulator n=1 Tax=Kerstersia sp. TaxID=1930783 RepID=UPI003F910D44
MNHSGIDTVDLNLLRVFEALMEEGAASRAAIRLGVTQPAISAALGRLRLLYSDPLFERTGRGLRPTTRANELAPMIEEALNHCRQALAPAMPGKTAEGRSITVGLSDDSEIALGHTLLSLVKRQLPGVRIIFRQTHSGLVQDMLMRHQIDLAIAAGGLSSPLIARHRLGRGNYLCLAGMHTPIPASAQEYAQRPHLLVSSGGFVGIVDEGLRAAGYRRRIKASTSHFAAVPFLLADSDLITTVPTHAAHAIVRMAPLKHFECPVPLPSYELELGVRIGSKHDDVLQAVKTLLLEAIHTHYVLS